MDNTHNSDHDTVGSILLKSAVHQLLLAVVAGAPGELLEADLDGGHVGERHAAPALLLVFYLNKQILFTKILG